jgi:paraquat-inducible protein A
VSAPVVSVGGPHVQCHSCELVLLVNEADLEAALGCPRCGARVHHRKPDSLIRTTAYLLAAAICYVPANLYPIMTVASLGQVQSDTILSGAIYLLFNGMWPLAVIVIVASVVVPLVKLVALSFLVFTVHRGSRRHPKERALLYRIVETVGRWSMVDVYVVTILVALVHLGALASVEAEIGSFFFAVVVVLTILAAESFDPRLIWDEVHKDDAGRMQNAGRRMTE